MLKCKQFLSVLIDFIFIFSIIGVICSAFLFGKYILFSKSSHDEKLYIVTETMSSEFENELSEGDVLYDPITKRVAGFIAERSVLSSSDGIFFLISFDSVCTSKADSLRTERLWFYYRVISYEEYQKMYTDGIFHEKQL